MQKPRQSSMAPHERKTDSKQLTRYLIVRKLKPLVFDRWSTRRPGVPTTMCGRFAKAIACAIMSTPPTT